MSRSKLHGKIVVQLPYDCYLSSVEQAVLSRYPISKRNLPYFILFHEFFHLMDTIQLTQGADDTEVMHLSVELQKAVRETLTEKTYRELSFEHQADTFAFQHLVQMTQKAS